eukprot:scaffold18880_cov68-Skeletonema_menzelii.AAC.3
MKAFTKVCVAGISWRSSLADALLEWPPALHKCHRVQKEETLRLCVERRVSSSIDDDEQLNGKKSEEEDQSTSTSIEQANVVSLPVSKLRNMLRERGLRVAGKREVLVERLLHPERETPAQIRNGIAH